MATLSFNKTVAIIIVVGAVQSERLQVVFFMGNLNKYQLFILKNLAVAFSSIAIIIKNS